MRFPIRFASAALIGAAAPVAPALPRDHIGIRYAEIPANAHAVVAEVQAKAGKEDALREATLPLVARSAPSPTICLISSRKIAGRPGHFIFCEIFVSRADFEVHNRMPHVQAWFARLPELVEVNSPSFSSSPRPAGRPPRPSSSR